MPSTNGYGPKKRAVLYIRVSSDEQAKKGYSIPDQLRELRENMLLARATGWSMKPSTTGPAEETLTAPACAT